jgi:hypothetical protein
VRGAQEPLMQKQLRQVLKELQPPRARHARVDGAADVLTFVSIVLTLLIVLTAGLTVAAVDIVGGEGDRLVGGKSQS